MKKKTLLMTIGILSAAVVCCLLWSSRRVVPDSGHSGGDSELQEFHRKAQRSPLFLALTQHPQIKLGGHGVSLEHGRQVAKVPGTWYGQRTDDRTAETERFEFERLLRLIPDSEWKWQITSFTPHTLGDEPKGALYDFYLEGTRTELQQGTGG